MTLSNDVAGANVDFVEGSLAAFCDSNGRDDDFACARSSCLRWVKEEISDRPEATLVVLPNPLFLDMYAVPFRVPSR